MEGNLARPLTLTPTPLKRVVGRPCPRPRNRASWGGSLRSEYEEEDEDEQEGNFEGGGVGGRGGRGGLGGELQGVTVQVGEREVDQDKKVKTKR